MGKQYQIAIKPIATATGEPGLWSLRAHGARHTKAEALEACERLRLNGYVTKLLPI